MRSPRPDAHEQIATLGAGLGRGAVLLHVDAHRAELARDGLRAGALGAERARIAQSRATFVQAAALTSEAGRIGEV